MNIGLVVLDTLRHEVFSEVMSQTQRRADHIFDGMYSTSRWTVPAHASLFTGHYPTEVGTHSHYQQLTTPRPTLAERLSGAGFDTLALSNNPYIDSFFNFDRGFDQLHRGPGLKGRPAESTSFDWPSLFNSLSDGYRKYPEAVSAIFRSDAPTIRTLANGVRMVVGANSMPENDSIEWLFSGLDEMGVRSQEGDLFLFANLMMCHSPYSPPPEYRSTEPYPVDPLELTLRDDPVTDEEHERHWDCYRGAAKYLDDQLGRLIELLEWDALFILSDHGELFGEHGLRQHQYGVYEELVHVPAVAFGTKVPSGRTESYTSILDIHQTIADLASVADSESRGFNLFQEPGARESVYAESVGNYRYSPDATGLNSKIPSSWGEPHYTYRAGELVYMIDKDGERVTGADGTPTTDSTASAFRNEVAEYRAQFERLGGTDEVEPEVTDDIEARLEHLGYR